MIKFISILLLTIQILSSLAAKPWEPESRDLPLHHKFLNETKTIGKNIEIIFYGDSITHGWDGNGRAVWAQNYAPLHAVNYGIGGDRTQHIIWRMENGEIEGLNPKIIVLKIGTNNLGEISHGTTDEDIAKGIKTILDIVHTKLPHTSVLLLGILPRGTDAFMPHIKNINNIISKYANGHTIQFLNMEKQFEGTDGHVNASLYVSDKLHLSAAGYEVWAHTMNPLLYKMLNLRSPLPWEPENRDVPAHQHFLNETKQMGAQIQAIFYGDSITAGWGNNEVWKTHYASLHAVNYGIGGDRTQHLIWRIQHGEVEGLHPKVVVLKIGTNNLGSHSDAMIAQGIKAIIDLLHRKLPQTKILLLGILPRGQENANLKVKDINSMIKHYDNGKTIRYLDMGSQFEDTAGHIHANLYTDGVHLTLEGYRVWAKTMDPLFKQMMGVH